MDRKYKVGGYVKLAKLWERAKDAAVAYHSSYYAEKFRDDADKRLVGVYIDITGNKEIYKRPEMVHLLKDCKNGNVNLIFSQTRAYLAANTCDFCFLLKYLFDLPMRVDIVTEADGYSMNLECRLYRHKWVQSITARDVMESGQVVENPMIGAIPSRNEVQRELDDLLMSM